MTTELTMLAWTLVLTLVYVFAPSIGRTRQYGLKWNIGPRDEIMPAPGRVTARLQRAQSNLFETLPLLIAGVLIAHVAGREGQATAIGVHLYFWGRVAYLPLYAFGVPFMRSAAYAASFAGLVLILAAILGVA